MNAGKLALVLDDSKDYIKWTAECLEDEGFEVETAASLAEAKEKVLNSIKRGNRPFDFIVTDLDLGSLWTTLRYKIDGIKFICWLRHLEPMRETPVLLHSTGLHAFAPVAKMKFVQQLRALLYKKTRVFVGRKATTVGKDRGKRKRPLYRPKP